MSFFYRGRIPDLGKLIVLFYTQATYYDLSLCKLAEKVAWGINCEDSLYTRNPIMQALSQRVFLLKAESRYDSNYSGTEH